MSRIKITAITVWALLLLLGFVWLGYYIALTRRFDTIFTPLDGMSVTMNGIRPYFDGVVIKDVSYENGITFSTIYMEGYPWQLLRNTPKHIYIEQADIKTDRLFDKKIVWPFPHTVPMTITEARITVPFLGQDTIWRGEFKQAPNIPLLLRFKSTTPEIDLGGQSEIRVKDGIVSSIDLEFHDAQIDYPLLETKRSGGWLSFTQDEKWSVVGEMEAGFVKFPEQFLSNVTVKLSGTSDEVNFSVVGNEQDTENSWVLDRQSRDVHIRYLDSVKTVEWTGLDASFLRKAGMVMTTFEPSAKKEIIVADAKPKEKKLKEKPKPIAPEHVYTSTVKPLALPSGTRASSPKAVAEKTIEVADTGKPQTAEAVPTQETAEQVPLYPLKHFVKGTIFNGFIYNKDLAYMQRACVSAAETGCWTARAQGGQFGYNTTDPRALPSYFTRIADYELSMQLRVLLASVNISSLALRGNTNGVQEMIVHGKDRQGRSIHIELSLDGLVP